MNATGCVTALGDGGEAFVVLLPDDLRYDPRPELTSLPPCPTASRRPPTPPPSSSDAVIAAAQPYKSRPRRKDRGAFVVLPETPAASTTTATTAAAVPSSGAPPPATSVNCSGRVSPFRGHGFRTPENGRSRATSPSAEPLRRQSSEPRIATADRRRPAAGKQRLSASTKDLSAAGKPPPAPTAVNKPSPARKKLPPAATPRKPDAPKSPVPSKSPAPASTSKSAMPSKSPVGPKSPTPLRTPKTPRRSRTPATRPTAATAKPTGAATAAKPAKAAATKTSTATNRAPLTGKLSPRLSKKPPAATTSTKANAPSSKDVNAPQLPDDRPPVTATANTNPTAVQVTKTTTGSTEPVSDPSVTNSQPSKIAQTTTTAAVVSPVTASTSATAIGTSHATNAVASPIVSGGPIVTAAPPPAAIAANTLATLSVHVDPTSAATSATPQRPPLSAAPRPREPAPLQLSAAAVPPARPAATVIVVDGGGGGSPIETATAALHSAADTVQIKSTTTPPLSYELQEIVVEPETENQSGRTAVQLSVDNKTLSTTSSSNGHKTVAWARQAEKIIVPADVTQTAATEISEAAAKDPAYKRFARKLCGGDRRRPPAVGKVTSAADGRAAKCWAAVKKRRPRLCGRCYRRRDRVGDGRPRPATGAATAASRGGGGKLRRWWRESRLWCCCRGKREKKLTSSSAGSVGALGIAPPNMRPPSSSRTHTVCGNLKRWLCCGCACCAVPKFVRRLCCCCSCCCRGDAQKRKSVDNPPRPSRFACTGCCTNIPKLDAVFVDHSSVMKGAIPVLPITLAWMCLVFNVIIPGAGTLSSGMLCLCVGKPRFTVNDNFQSRLGAFCVNFIVAIAQMFTVLFCLVGWGWSIWWGVIMLKMAKKYQKVKIVDQPTDAPIAIDHNHQI